MKSQLKAVAAYLMLSAGVTMGAPVEIDSLKELVKYAQQDGVSVKLKPGVYDITKVK